MVAGGQMRYCSHRFVVQMTDPPRFEPQPAKGLIHQNIVKMAEARVLRSPDQPIFRYRGTGGWAEMTGREWWNRASSAAAVLRQEHGVEHGSTVGVMATNRMEWVVFDLAIAMAGAISVPIEPMLDPDQVEFMLSDAGCQVVVTDMPQRIGQRRAVALDSTRPATDDRLDEVRETLGPSELASIVYTSGTTGQPKGVEITHENLVFESWALRTVFPVQPGDTLLLSLPLSHIFGRHLLWAAVEQGSITCISSGRSALSETMATIQPTFAATFPMLLERLRKQIELEIEARGRLVRHAFARALSVGREAMLARAHRTPLSTALAARAAVANRSFFRRIRARLGGHLRFIVVGGGSSNIETIEFFEACGIGVLAGYGLTETCGAISVQRLHHRRPGTVGTPLPNCEVRLDQDGEIWVRGPNVTPGYHHRRAETVATFDEHGWLRTGDLGKLSGGSLVLLERKSDRFKTSQQQLISPGKIELQLVTSPFIAHAMVVGEGQHSVTALISLDEGALLEQSGREGWGCRDYDDLRSHPRVRALVQQHVDVVNQRLHHYERIRRWAASPRPFGVQELTPTMRVRRREVMTRYRRIIETLTQPESTGV